MPKQEVSHPEKKTPTGAYSAGVLMEGWLFISGQGPLDYATGSVVKGTIQEETKRTLEHVGKVLKAAGAGFEDVVRCTCYLADIRDFDAFNQVYGEVFRGIRPARTTVQAVLWGGIKIEIDAIAYAGQKSPSRSAP